jgi:cytochrome c-type biogenesis protein CcmE
MQSRNQGRRIGIAIVVVLAAVAYLAISGVRSNKSYYVTIQELHAMGPKAYTRHLRVAGNVEPGSIQHSGTNVNFVLIENANKLHVSYLGEDPPPDTYKDNAQALAIGTYGHDGIFHATQLQAKCASKYAPAKPGSSAPGAMNAQASMTEKPAMQTAAN